MSAMGSCIKVVKQKICFPTEKKNVVSCNRLKPKRPLFCHHMQKKGHFSVMGIAQNIVSLRSVGNSFAISSSATFE
jgi:hypothetical protein